MGGDNRYITFMAFVLPNNIKGGLVSYINSSTSIIMDIKD